uniref:Uncharacterized protein n=1 Tax=Micrurus spixii TaxID=129469 RepID=A0A2D4MU43_9SAUR
MWITTLRARWTISLFSWNSRRLVKMAQPSVSKPTRFLVAKGTHLQLGIDKEQGHRREICIELADLPKNFPQLPTVGIGEHCSLVLKLMRLCVKPVALKT